MRNVGTIVMGIRTPIIKEGDDLASIVVDSVLKASKSEKFDFNDKDVIAVTEAVVGISEGNFATLDQIAKDIKKLEKQVSKSSFSQRKYDNLDFLYANNKEEG